MSPLIPSLASLALCCAAHSAMAAEPVRLASPDGRNIVTVDTDKLSYALSRDGAEIIQPSPLGLNLDIGSLGAGARLVGQRHASADSSYAVVAGKAASARDRYRQVELLFEAAPKGPRFSVLVRAYDEGVALRYAVPRQAGVTGFKVMTEATQFNFARDYNCWGANMGRFDSSFEGEYDPLPASRIRAFHNFMAPLVCKTGKGQASFAIAESDVKNYPGFYLSGRSDGGLGIAVTLPPRFDNDRNYRFRKTVSAQVSLESRDFQSPWRVVMLGDTPGALTASHLISNLAAPSRIQDTSWIKPSKTSWDWYNDWDIDLPGKAKPGIDTATYKAFVDFSHSMKLDDILIDEGWSVGSDIEPNPKADLTRARPELDMPALLAHARAKGVGVWLWVQWHQLDQQMDAAFKQYQAWGIKGVKVDFMNRNDQEMVDWYHKVLEKAAAHKLMVNLHGAFPPNGLNRTWPNYITQEGVLGAENNKWSARITARHNVTLPFTRMILGPMDYTPGGFVNATPATFTPRNHVPMAMTTRGHGLAMFVVYDSPFQVVADGPRAFRKADGSWADGAAFVQQVPTSWDETRVLAGDIGQYIVSARRRGDTWYIGAMTNEDGRTLSVPLDFLGQGSFAAEVLQDGAKPDQLSSARRQVAQGQKLTLKLAPSGGAVAVIRPRKAAGQAGVLPLYVGKPMAGVSILYGDKPAGQLPDTSASRAGALRLSWKDIWSTSLGVDSAPLDLRPFLDQGVISFDLKVNELAKGGVYFRLDCGPECERKVSYVVAGRAAQGKGWQQLSYALSCFHRKGDDLGAVTRPFMLEAYGSGDVEVANLRILKEGKPNATCPDYRTMAVTPAPQEESWSLDWWMPRHREKLAEIARRRAAGERTGLVFIGDSITHGWENDGKEVWERLYKPHNALNLGYGGDRTENVLWRLQHGEVDGIDPKVAVLMFGTNNTGHRYEEPERTVAGIARDIAELKQRLPRTKILLLAVFPRDEKPDGRLRRINDRINQALPRLADGKQVFFLDINQAFLQPDGSLSKDIMPDLLHPNARGYEIWARAMQPELDRLMRNQAWEPGQ